MTLCNNAHARAQYHRYMSDVMRPKIDAIEPVIEDLDPHRVIDAGSGIGAWTARLAAQGREVVSIEPSPDMIQVQTQLGLHPVDERLEDVDWTDQRADLILCLDTIEHLPAKAQGPTLAAMARTAPVLMATDRPGFAWAPLLIRASLLVGELLGRDYHTPPILSAGSCTHERERTPTEWADLGQAYGFDVELIKTYPNRGPLGKLSWLPKTADGPHAWPFALYLVKPS